MKCPKCGKELSENIRFCTSCGAAMNPASTPKSGINPLIPYIVTMAASIITVVANFIQYLTVSGWFYSRKISVFSLIMESLNNPDKMLGGVGDKVVFGLIIASVVFSLLTFLFATLRLKKCTIIFAILTLLPLLLTGKAFIHYIGIGLTVISAIWYMIVDRKSS